MVQGGRQGVGHRPGTRTRTVHSQGCLLTTSSPRMFSVCTSQRLTNFVLWQLQQVLYLIGNCVLARCRLLPCDNDKPLHRVVDAVWVQHNGAAQHNTAHTAGMTSCG